MAERLIQTVFSVLDRRRFPWIQEQREPNSSEHEAASAVLASAAMFAMRRLRGEASVQRF